MTATFRHSVSALSVQESRGDSITGLLGKIREGDREAVGQLFRNVYPHLKQLAAHIIRRRNKGHNAPKATTLVHSACQRLLERNALAAENRRHFFRLFCRAMEDEWVERARYDLARKRRAPGIREEIADFSKELVVSSFDFCELRIALQELARRDAQAAEVVTLRFYCDATLEETAAIVGTSLAVVRRNWSYAKAWLHERLSRIPGGCESLVE